MMLEKSKTGQTGSFEEIFFSVLVGLLKNFFLGLKQLLKYKIFTGILIVVLSLSFYYLIDQGLQIHPLYFDDEILKFIFKYPIFGRASHHLGVIVFLAIFCLGRISTLVREQVDQKIKIVGIKNAIGESPRLVKLVNPDKNHTKMIIDTNGTSLSDFEAKRGVFESTYSMYLEGIKKDKNNLSLIHLDFYKKPIPEFCHYKDFSDLLKKPCNIVLGQSLKGPLIQDIREWPHMIVAGTTGYGKSVFLNQTFISLLRTTPHMQLLLIDLKRGVEVSLYKGIRNVHMAKDENGALVFLSRVHDEMMRRFKYLEEKNLNEINEKRDKMDRLVVAIDEASMLYAKDGASEELKKIRKKAAVITDEIAKLGRAAGIHLIFSTQKVTKGVINTNIQDNATGRVCFSMNSFAGSTNMVGDKSAKAMDKIKGRAICLHGQEHVEIQTPFMDKTEVAEWIKLIKEEGSKAYNNVVFDAVELQKLGPVL